MNLLKTTALREPTTQQKNRLCLCIRWMIRHDINAVVTIEQQSFKFPWNKDDFLSFLRKINCIGMVVEHENRVIGFMIYELHKRRLDVLNFAVHPEFRRYSVGTKMIEKLIDKLHQQRRQSITLKVSETNIGAQLFFKKQKFRAIQTLRAYYDDSNEDAYVMQFLLPNTNHQTDMCR